MVHLGYGLSPSVVDILLSDLSCNPAAKCKAGRTTPLRRIPIDVIENDTEFDILADVPGVHKEAIGLDVHKETLTISISQAGESQAKPDAHEQADAASDDATSPHPVEEPTAADGGEEPAAVEAPAAPAQPNLKVLRRERAQRFADRAVKLPETADLGQAQATCDSGVLTVKVPKKTLPSPHRIAVA